jgi:hypothetical protein
MAWQVLVYTGIAASACRGLYGNRQQKWYEQRQQRRRHPRGLRHSCPSSSALPNPQMTEESWHGRKEICTKQRRLHHREYSTSVLEVVIEETVIERRRHVREKAESRASSPFRRTHGRREAQNRQGKARR